MLNGILIREDNVVKVRAMKFNDIPKLKELHQKFYSDLEFPDFMYKFYCGFIVTDENDDIIIGGGLQPTAEVILVTDKDKGGIKIGRALIEACKVSLYVGRKFGLDELVAFIKNNDSYSRHLVRHGFYPRSSALAIKVPKWEKTHAPIN